MHRNPGQWKAYNSTGNCVVIAGPGSGKTKTLTIKLARLLSEDVETPRGIACITYNNECAKELEQRIEALGVEPYGRIFIGTVHSFSLTQIVLPYAKTARLDLPEDFRVATLQEQRAALERAFDRVIGGPENPHFSWRLRMDRYRRTNLNRDDARWYEQDRQTADLVEAYEKELRSKSLIDFDDMPLLAIRALRENKWLQRAILAKFPVLIVDEYQDLGHALHAMVMGLCFSTGIRLFAVGDVDQSIYGFTGANPEFLKKLATRQDVETIRLKFNYRCGSQIVTASQYALGEERDYEAADGAEEGRVFFHPLTGGYDNQAEYLFSKIMPDAKKRLPDLKLGQIAVLYPAAWIGDSVSHAAQIIGIDVLRTDGNALYPRSSRLMRWLELCAIWCCGGWKVGVPRFSKLIAEGCMIFVETLLSEQQKISFQRDLLAILWRHRDCKTDLHKWLSEIYDTLIYELISNSRTLDEEGTILKILIEKTGKGGDADGMTIAQFSGHGEGNDRVNLSTLHSAKGREFSLVILFGMDRGRIPRNDASPLQLKEARRLFYVGFTRAETEIHVIYTNARPSPFVLELKDRLEQDQLDQ